MCFRAARAADRTGSDDTSRVSGVATNPGQTELTHTLYEDHASDWERVSAARPPFDAPYPSLLPNACSACCAVTSMIGPLGRRRHLRSEPLAGQEWGVHIGREHEGG